MSPMCEVEVEPSQTCLESTWKCHDNLKCIEMSDLCNGIPDCEDSSDERNCPEEVTHTPENIEEITQGKKKIVLCGCSLNCGFSTTHQQIGAEVSRCVQFSPLAASTTFLFLENHSKPSLVCTLRYAL